MSHRFFVSPRQIDRDQVHFDPAQAHQLRNVLRMCPGDRVTVLDNSGREYEVELEQIQRHNVTGRVRVTQMSQTEPSLSLTLYLSMLKGERFEWVLQKGTELGVQAFVPVISRRTIVRDPARIEKKRARWERILCEAAEQSHRGRLPALSSPLIFSQACEQSARADSLALIPWEKTTTPTLLHALCSLTERPTQAGLFIGPEGGFEEDEISHAQSCGIRPVTLGPRILRAETAALAAVAILLAESTG